MRVAIAGTGSFAKHFINEFPGSGIEVVVLTRSRKDFLDGKKGVVEQRITDYSSVAQHVELLSDCDALVSAIFDLTQAYVDVHLALIEACKQTPKCKRFIPSEFFANTEEFPEHPDGSSRFNIPVKDALKAQRELEWTVVSIEWVMDYIVPSANRCHPDIGPWFALDLPAKTMTIVGSGRDAFAITSARDVAKATAALLKSLNKWRHFTYMQGMESTWLQLAEEVKSTGGVTDLKVYFLSLRAFTGASSARVQCAGLILFQQLVFSSTENLVHACFNCWHDRGLHADQLVGPRRHLKLRLADDRDNRLQTARSDCGPHRVVVSRTSVSTCEERLPHEHAGALKFFHRGALHHGVVVKQHGLLVHHLSLLPQLHSTHVRGSFDHARFRCDFVKANK